MNKYAGIALMLVLLSVLSACCSLCPKPEPQQGTIARLDDSLILLARAVDAVVDTLPPAAQDDEIFTAAIRNSGDPSLLKPFDGHVLKARLAEGFAVILVCSPDGKEGIIEDVSCTTRPDTHRPAGSPCVYFLDVKRVCATN